MRSKWKKTGKAALAFLIPIAIFYLFEWYIHNPWKDIRTDIQILNIVFFELVMVLLYMLIGRLHVALLLETLVFMIYGLANYFVLSFRGQPILPWDFFSLETAASVAGGFRYELDKQATIVLAGFLVLIVIELVFCRNRLKNTVGRFYHGPFKSWAFRVPMTAVTLTLLLGFVSLLHNEEFVQEELRMYDKLFTPTSMSTRDGTAVAFLLELQYIDVEKPEGYEKEEIEALLPDENAYEEAPEMPNIIVIMDEAFSDPAILGEFETNMDYMPFIHAMQQGGNNAITGNLHVSVLGGNTANSEFEFLTGHSMAFLPQGSVAYQQYIQAEHPSLASYLRELGYTTMAAHPYYASGWDRDEVYPFLGFDKAFFHDRFQDVYRIRNYVSDESAFDYIIKKYEEKKEGEPLFFFEVTMQNHSGYTEEFENFSPAVTVEGSESKSLNMYLSLMKETDAAVEKLLTYFVEQEEDTIIVFFGDHQPTDSVVEPIWQLQGKTGSELSADELALRYQVPFFIWANFDIEEQQNVEMSINYLGGYMLEVAGIELPAYQAYLESLRAQVPVVTAQYMETVDGYAGMQEGYEEWLKETESEDLLDVYRKMQYYLLFDNEE